MKNIFRILTLAAAASTNVALWGRHGVGKTQAVQQYAAAMDAYLCTIILSQIDPLVLGGYPGREQLEDGTCIETFAKGEWVWNLRNAAKKGKKTILFLDEFNRADRFAHNAAMTLVLDKVINGHHLPKDCFIVVAMNPETAGDMGVNELTDPMISRFAHVPVNHDAGSWLNWAEKANVNIQVRTFIAKAKNKLSAFELDFADAVGNRIAPDPRSWVSVGKITDALTVDGEIDMKRFNHEGMMLIAGLVGQAEAAAYLVSVKDNFNRPFTYEEILKANKATLDKVAELIKNNQTQVLVESLEQFHKKGAQENVSVANLKKGFVKFILACPVDIQAGFWSIEGDNGAFWVQAMASSEMPREVAVPLGLAS